MSSKKRRESTLVRSTPARYPESLITTPRAAFALAFGVLVLIASVQMPESFWEGLLTSTFIQSDVLGFVSLAGLYTVAILLMAPLSPFALMAGLLFGFWWGTFLALFALNLGAALAFLIARYLLRRQFVRKLSESGRMAVVARAMRGDEIMTIAVLRLNPIVPFNLQNYVCGATGVNFARYAVGTFLGAAPFTVALVYLGDAGRQLVVATGLEVEQWTLLLFVFGVVLTIPMTWAIVRKTLKRLREYRNNDKTATDTE